MPFLHVIKGPRCGMRFELGEKTTLGRAPECEIELPDNEVSRNQAEIVKNRFSFILRDLGSKNGTFVNGQKTDEHILLRNDEVRIGASLMIYDPDFDFQNARFSGSPVFVSAPHDETIEFKLDSRRDTAALIDDETIALVRQLSELIAPPSNDLPVLLSSMLYSLSRIFHAERAFIMLWDPILKELQPVVSLSPMEKHISVSRKVVNDTFFEKTAFLFSGEVEGYPYEEDAPPASYRSSMSAPLLCKDETIGIIYLDKPGGGHYDLKSLSLLQTVARFVAQSIAQSRMLEKILLKADAPHVVDIIGLAPSVTTLRDEIEKVAAHDTAVLILGETGTGKELIAHALHERSHRREYPFIAINCTAVPENLFESELFGYEKGAFTGAAALRRGVAEMAHGGTLFLDEIGDLSLSLQPKLLRFLQEKNFYRVGGTRPIRVNVRVVAATNSDLKEKVKTGAFREDLYYRLSVMVFKAPPLRERREDIRLLAEHFLKIYADRMKKRILGFSPEAIHLLEKYPWHGNVRELMNAVERAVILVNEPIIKPEQLFLQPISSSKIEKEQQDQRPLAEVEKEHIRRVLKQCRGNQVHAAKILGIHRNTLRNKLEEYGLPSE